MSTFFSNLYLSHVRDIKPPSRAAIIIIIIIVIIIIIIIIIFIIIIIINLFHIDFEIGHNIQALQNK